MLSRRDFANAVRALAMDAVQKANSGHPGMPMGMADIAEVLWNDFLNHNPNNPDWANRDRFVLSNGHGCMLQYALLHLSGYDLSIEDIKRFRTLHSKTPGHPEYGDTPGVETTTGPLGQGFANAVGMALAEKNLAATFNRDNFSVIDHYTYVFLGDGCLMEGVSHEAASLAGTWGLGKLVAFWDDNQVSIDGDTAGWFSDDTPARFRAYDWHVIEDVDGHDSEAIKKAIVEAREETNKPTLICCRTVIGFGAPNKQGTAATHGAPLGEEEIAKARSCLEWYHGPFDIPQEYYQAWDARAKGAEREASWKALFSAYQETYPEQAAELQRRLAKRLPQNFLQDTQQFVEETQSTTDALATRKASAKCLEAVGSALPELIGGSADLSESNNTLWSGSKVLTRNDPKGNYIHYGVREFGMFAIMNGLSLHGGFIPYGGTFLVFSDYGRNAIRLAALMRQKVIFVLTHDSIGLGEDGPTHQPIEHANMLRATPGLHVWRPADLTETASAWQAAIERKGPTCLLLTRQGVPQLERSKECVAQIKRGGYALLECDGEPEAIVMATGSETHLALNAGKKLNAQGHRVRVVAMPCTEIFDAQSEAYRRSVLPDDVTVRVAVEAGAKDFWYKYVGLKGRVMGLDRFGFSAPYKAIYAHVGLTEEKIIENVEDLLQKKLTEINHD